MGLKNKSRTICAPNTLTTNKHHQADILQPFAGNNVAPQAVGDRGSKSIRILKETELLGDWYASCPPLPSDGNPALTPPQLSAILKHASSLHASAVSAYQSKSSSSAAKSASDNSFLQRILQSGTLSDRLSALTLLVQSDPVCNIKALETLKGMAERGKGKGGRDESLKALRCVVDWWVGGGAPDKKLRCAILLLLLMLTLKYLHDRYFRDQPLSHPAVTDRHLLLWFFEDWLKKYFFSIIHILEV